MAQASLVEIDPPNHGLPDPRRQRKLFEHCVADKALIDAAQSLHEPLEQAFQSTDELGEAIQQASAVELSNIVSNSLDAKYAFAFGVDLQSQLAAVQLEDRQIIRRSLDRDFPLRRPHVSWAVFRPALVSEDRLDGLQVQRRTAAIDQGLEHLLHAPANCENQIAAVLHLIVGEVVTKAAALLLLKVERKA